VQEVSPLPLQVGVTFGNDPALRFPIRRAVFLPSEVALCAFESLTFLAEVETFDGVPIGVVGIRENPHVDTNDLLWFFQVSPVLLRPR
jgi:hypothetical protein